MNNKRLKQCFPMLRDGSVVSFSDEASKPLSRLRLTRRGKVCIGILSSIAAMSLWSMVFNVNTSDAFYAQSGEVYRCVRVEQDESVWSIAQNVFPSQNVTEQAKMIMSVNNLASSTVHPGQLLIIPMKKVNNKMNAQVLYVSSGNTEAMQQCYELQFEH